MRQLDGIPLFFEIQKIYGEPFSRLFKKNAGIVQKSLDERQWREEGRCAEQFGLAQSKGLRRSKVHRSYCCARKSARTLLTTVDHWS